MVTSLLSPTTAHPWPKRPNQVSFHVEISTLILKLGIQDYAFGKGRKSPTIWHVRFNLFQTVLLTRTKKFQKECNFIVQLKRSLFSNVFHANGSACSYTNNKVSMVKWCTVFIIRATWSMYSSLNRPKHPMVHCSHLIL